MVSEEERVARAADWGILNFRRENIDVVKMASILAAIDSAQYYVDNMLHAKQFSNKEDVIDFAVENAVPGGLTLEFGVASGNSINIIARKNKGKVYGFDSFEGLPEDWRDRYRRGAYSGLPSVELPPNVQLIIGWFNDVLPKFVENYGEKVSFVHIDCDLYSSTKTIFKYLGKFIEKDTIIHFDEYFNYPGWRQHEYKAFQEFVTETGLEYTYIALNGAHQQVTVRVTGRTR